MPGQNPVDTVNALIEAMNRGDIEAAVALYEPGATLVVEPGKLATGTEALRKHPVSPFCIAIEAILIVTDGAAACQA